MPQPQRLARYGMAWAVLRKVLKNRPTPSWGEDAVQEMVLLAATRPELPQWKLWLKCQDVVVKYQRRERRDTPDGLGPQHSGLVDSESRLEEAPGDMVDARVDAAQRVADLMALDWTDTQRQVLEAVYETGTPSEAAVLLGWTSKRVANTLAAIRAKAEAAGLGSPTAQG